MDLLETHVQGVPGLEKECVCISQKKDTRIKLKSFLTFVPISLPEGRRKAESPKCLPALRRL
jgi:hypothetical protein